MGQYGEAAVKATKRYRSGNPRLAWDDAVREVTESRTSQEEPCPRCAYLGLCEDGHVSGIPKGDYCLSKHKKNKEYALKALRLLEQDDSRFSNGATLWQAVMKGEKISHHQQMDVVLSLWRARLITGQR
jgi:hypothetical protein